PELLNHSERDDNVSPGKWQQADPLRYVDGANRYQQLQSCPASLLDPSGVQAATTQAIVNRATATSGRQGETYPFPAGDIFAWCEGTGNGFKVQYVSDYIEFNSEVSSVDF